MRGKKNPFRGFVDTISEMNRMREHWMTGYEPAREVPRTHATAWVPTTDIFARGRDLIVQCELAGVRREDLDVTVSNGTLIISGERRRNPDSEEANYYVRERYYGAFRRTMNLPEGIDGSRVEATFEDGMLQIRVRGGAAPPETQRIEIGGSG
jgi:HSP20 family protein